MRVVKPRAAVKLGTLWGYIERTGKVVIPPKFESISLFRSGMALFSENRKLGYIDKSGAVIVPPKLDWGTEFVGGVAAVSDSSGYGVVDTSGRMVCRLDNKSTVVP